MRIQDVRISCLRGERPPPIYVPCPHYDGAFSSPFCCYSMMDHLAESKDQRIKGKKGHGFIPWALKENFIQREPSGKFSLCAIKKHLGKHGYQSEEREKVSLLSNDNSSPFSDSGYASMGMNQDPVIVKGYPILARNHHERGLELPLNMMAGLGEASRVTNWAGDLVVKGFSTLFCPTRRLNNSIQWHYLFEKDGGQISYLSADDRCHDRVKLNFLDARRLPFCRNFLGWASSIEINTDTPLDT